MKFAAAFFEVLAPVFYKVKDDDEGCLDKKREENSNDVVLLPFPGKKRTDFSNRDTEHVQDKLPNSGAIINRELPCLIADEDGGKDRERYGKCVKDNRRNGKARNVEDVPDAAQHKKHHGKVENTDDEGKEGVTFFARPYFVVNFLFILVYKAI